MTFETAVSEMFERFPDLRAKSTTPVAETKDAVFSVFETLLLPKLETAVEAQDLRGILTICAFLEDTAESAEDDPRLAELLRAEVGDWLANMAHEELLAPWLGSRTKEICRYVPGRATKRRLDALEPSQSGFRTRLKNVMQEWLRRDDEPEDR